MAAFYLPQRNIIHRAAATGITAEIIFTTPIFIRRGIIVFSGIIMAIITGILTAAATRILFIITMMYSYSVSAII